MPSREYGGRLTHEETPRGSPQEIARRTAASGSPLPTMATHTPGEIRPETIAREGAVHLDGRASVRARCTKARMVVLGGLLVAVVALAACGGGSSASGSASASSTTVVGGAAGSGSLAAFRACMTGQGIILPQRSGTSTGSSRSTTPGATRPAAGSRGTSRFNTAPPGVNAATYQAALNACRSKLPTGGSGARSSAFQVYRSCLGDHGVTLPSSGGLSGINQSDPKVVAAVNACKALVPAGGFGGGSATTSTTIAGA
jgi:hypothetical protein